jgi:long-chain acyl-CoA synthetase
MSGAKGNAILDAWERTLARSGDAAAVRRTDGAVARTFADIEREGGEIAAQFEALAPHSAVAVQIGNSEQWPAVLLALFRRQLVPLPLGRHMEAAELRAAMETCGAAALATVEAGRLRMIASPREPMPHTCDFLKLTSGTTSAPRAVRFQAHQLVADCDHICASMGITDRDLNFGVIPFSHSYGFSNLLTPLLCRGVPLVASEDRMPRAILHELARSGATVFPGMPVFFDKLVALENAPALPALRLCISAGAPLPRAVGEAFTRRFGLKVHTFYGSSECGGIAYDASPDPVYEDGFVGLPMRGVEIVRDACGESGRIAVRSAAVGDGYFPPQDEETLCGGQFIPGDLVRWGDRGMYLAGRASDVINIAGRKLNPAEIEARIAEFPGVRQVVVFGVPSPLRGEEPVACVAGEGIERGGLARFCQERLSQWQMPRDFWLLPEIAANERGKVSRRALAEEYQRHAAERRGSCGK